MTGKNDAFSSDIPSTSDVLYANQDDEMITRELEAMLLEILNQRQSVNKGRLVD